MNFDFGEVLTRAGQITWRRKNLWLAGIVVSLIGLLPALISFAFTPALLSFSADVSQLNRQMPAMLLLNALTVLVSILSIPVYVIAMAIPSLATLRLESGSATLSFGELLKATLPYFWRILGVVLLIWVGMFVAMLPILGCGVLLSLVTFGFGTLCIVPVIIPLAILVFALMEQGMAAVLVDNLGVSQALQRAWQLIKKNIGVMVLMSIIIYLGSTLIGMILAVPMMIPMFGYMTNIFRSAGSMPDLQAMQDLYRNMVKWMLVFSPLYAIFQGILLTFMQAAWTLTYLRLTQSQPGPVPAALEAHA